MKRLFEVCAGNLESAIEAVRGGATRIELCSALSLDGLTPSLGMLKTVREIAPHLIIHVLIRPREGNFVYQEKEVEVMERDITAAIPYADGIVCGALLPNGDIDLSTMRRLIQASSGLPVTFHRAFDVCREPLTALEQIIELGCHRLLTSGQQSTAFEGIPFLRRLQEQSAGRLIIMPGSGVNENNARQIIQQTGVTEIHGSATDATGITCHEKVRRICDAITF